MKKKTTLRNLVAFVFAFLMILSVAICPNQQVKAANSDNLTLHVYVMGTHTFIFKEPDASSECIAWAQRGTTVEFLGEEKNGFLKISQDGVTGYIGVGNLRPYAGDYAHLEGTGKLAACNCDSYVSLREYPTTWSTVLCTIPKDGEVKLEQGGGHGFYKVTYNGKTGYALASCFSIKDDLYDSTISMVVKCNSFLSFRKEPSTSGKELAKMKPGTIVHLMSTAENGFYTVVYGNTVGYAAAQYLIPEYGVQHPEWPERPLIVTDCEDVSFRTGPDSSSARIDCLVAGTVVTNCSTVSNGYRKVRYGGQEGWITDKYLVDIYGKGSADGLAAPAVAPAAPEPVKSASTVTPMDGIVEGAPTYMRKVINCKEWVTLRETPSTSANSLAQVPLGAEVISQGIENDEFSRVMYGGKQGYILSSYLSEEYIHDGESRTVCNCKEWVTLRKSPSTSAAEICKVPLGATVHYNGDGSNGFSLVTYNGYQGYILSDYLK